MSKKCLNQIVDYVPRHLRLGVCCELPEIHAFQDIVESVPVVDDSGSVICSHTLVKGVPVDEVMRKYKVSQFRLTSMVKSGVPLKMVNINSSNIASIEQLKEVCQSLENADKYVQRIMDERKDRESWFHPELESSVHNH